MVDEAPIGRLSEAQNERIFRTEILPDYLPDDLGRADHPTLIVLGGQPGSGKTALLTGSHSELERTGSMIRVAGDDLRSYHPGYMARQTADPETASRFTQADAGIWSQKLLAAATARGVHVVFETTMRRPENVERIMTTGRDANYRVEAHALAVNPRVSWQGCHYRFEEVHHAGEAARIPPRSVHDAAVTGLAESLERIERHKLADRIVLQTVAGVKIYENALEQGQWQSPTVARQALEEARNRPPSRDEIDRFAAVWESVLSRMQDRGASSASIDEVRGQSRDDFAWLLDERRRADADDAIKSAREVKQRIGGELGPVIAQADPAEFSASSRIRDRNREKEEHQIRPGEVLIPGRELPDLSAAEIGIKLRESSRMAEKRSEIERLSLLVYGNAAATSATVESIDGAMSGSVAGQDIRTGRLGHMAGQDGGFLRAESPERQTAKAHLPQLAAAMEDYGRTVDFERHQIETRHREEQHRQRQEIRTPSEGLQKVLEAPVHERTMRLNAAPDLRRELERVTASITRRLDVDDRRALRQENVGHVARSLNVSQAQAASLLRIQTQTQGLTHHVQSERQSLQQRAGLTLKR